METLTIEIYKKKVLNILKELESLKLLQIIGKKSNAVRKPEIIQSFKGIGHRDYQPDQFEWYNQ